jgi:hypothetical protein
MAPHTFGIVILGAFLIAIGARARADLPRPAQPEVPGKPTFRLVIWYDRRRPFETFHHRAYDLAKGEYTKAVDDWRMLMERSYPGYTVLVRDRAVTAGDSADKVLAAVADEEELALAKSIMQAHGFGDTQRRSNYSAGYHGFSWSPQTTAPRRDSSSLKNAVPHSFSPLGAAHPAPSPTYLFPNPMPYPRPHP